MCHFNQKNLVYYCINICVQFSKQTFEIEFRTNYILSPVLILMRWYLFVAEFMFHKPVIIVIVIIVYYERLCLGYT